MAQVILKKSSVAARVPVAGDLVYGELAINYQDGLLYYKKADNTIGSIGGGTATSITITNITKQENTVTVAGSNTYTIAYTIGYLEVHVNGILLSSSDFTAITGTTVVIPDLLVGDIVNLVSTTPTALSVAGTGLAITSGILTLNSASTATANTIVLRDGTGQVLTTGIKFSDNTVQTTASVPGVTTGKSIAMAIIFGG